MAAIGGSKVGMRPELQSAFFWTSALLCLVEWPWITMRCLHSDRIAPAPSIFVHAAPVSLVSLAFMEVVVAPQLGGGLGGAGLTRATLYAAHFFFAATSSALAVTLLLAYRRRSILRSCRRIASSCRPDDRNERGRRRLFRCQCLLGCE